MFGFTVHPPKMLGQMQTPGLDKPQLSELYMSFGGKKMSRRSTVRIPTLFTQRHPSGVSLLLRLTGFTEPTSGVTNRYNMINQNNTQQFTTAGLSHRISSLKISRCLHVITPPFSHLSLVFLFKFFIIHFSSLTHVNYTFWDARIVPHYCTVHTLMSWLVLIRMRFAIICFDYGWWVILITFSTTNIRRYVCVCAET